MTDFTLLVTTRKRKRKLERLLDSLDGLNRIIPLEAVVVVDGADDVESIEFLEEWSRRHHRFHARVLISKRQCGPGAARNLGLAIALGQVVAFTDTIASSTPPGWTAAFRGELQLSRFSTWP